MRKTFKSKNALKCQKEIKLALNNLVLRIGGEAGAGIILMGRLFAKACLHAGLNAYGLEEYPSLIRGGHNTFTLKVGTNKVYSPVIPLNILVALNKESIERHQRYLTHEGIIIYDSDEVKTPPEFRRSIIAIPIPMQELIKKFRGAKIMRNAISLGALMALTGLEFKLLEDVIKQTFESRHKVSAIIKQNIRIAKLGYNFAKTNFKKEFAYKLKKIKCNEKQIILDGNEAITLGALRAGCKFYAAYPMTPATSILHNMAAREGEYNLIVKQTEDEISAINMAIGASHAGVRSMCATSGGGFCLMTEALGLAGMAEIPLVIVNGQRPGPSTGLPTRTEQGDLRFALHASQGEFPRVVIAPGDVDECFYKTFEAFNIAEKYHLPVIILSDQFLTASYCSTAVFNPALNVKREGFAKPSNLFLRYAFTDSGVSPRAVPGQENMLFIASSYEHDNYGITVEHPDNRAKMMEKRMKKLRAVAAEIPAPIIYGDNDAAITIIAWGSLKGPVLEAMECLKKEGIKTNFLHLVYLFPFPAEGVAQALKNAGSVLLVEQNSTAQLNSLIREYNLTDVPDKLLKYDGRQILPDDIYDKIKRMLDARAKLH